MAGKWLEPEVYLSKCFNQVIVAGGFYGQNRFGKMDQALSTILYNFNICDP